jgi:predicted RNA-binding protein with PUA-like domain
VVVDFRSVKSLKKPISLSEIKANPNLAKMSLVTSARLSVQPVTKDEWDIIILINQT